MSSAADYLGESLLSSLSTVRDAIANEVQEMGLQLSERLAVQFALGIAKSCGDLHSENRRLRNQLGILEAKASDDEVAMSGPFRTELSPWLSEAKMDLSSASSPSPNALKAAEVPLERSESPLLDETPNDVANADSASPRSPKQVRCIATQEDEELSSKNSCESERGLQRTSQQSSAPSGRARSTRVLSGGRLSWREDAAGVMMLVTSRQFEAFFNVMIIFNCCIMGLEAEQIAKGPSSELSELALIVAEQIFCIAFTLELGLRMYAFGWREFVPCKYRNKKEGPWNVMDMFLVVSTGILFTWVLPVLNKILGGAGDKDGLISTLSVLRSVRLLRLVRVVKSVPALREAWLLLQGLTDSGRTLMWTVCVIVVVTYIWAIFGTVLIARELYEKRAQVIDNPTHYEDLTTLIDYCGGLTAIMFTLIQLLTLDSWNTIVRALMIEIGWCWVYFYSYIAVAVFVLMNLVTAIIVENAHAHSKTDEDHAIKQREKDKKAELDKLQELFKAMDEDGSGTLSWDEFGDSFKKPETVRKWKLLDFDPEECKELFKLLDDGDGEIETTEFFDGLGKMKGNAQSRDIFRLQKTVEHLAKTVESAEEEKSVKSHASTSRKAQSGNAKKNSICTSEAKSGPSGKSSPAGSTSEVGSSLAVKLDQCREGPHYPQLLSAVKAYLDEMGGKSNPVGDGGTRAEECVAQEPSLKSFSSTISLAQSQTIERVPLTKSAERLYPGRVQI